MYFQVNNDQVIVLCLFYENSFYMEDSFLNFNQMSSLCKEQ